MPGSDGAQHPCRWRRHGILQLFLPILLLLIPVVAQGQSPNGGFNPGANGTIWALALQPDGKILVGGAFTRLGGGENGLVTRNSIGRLNADGSIDKQFNASTNGTVRTIALQADGKILVGGSFTTAAGTGSEPVPRFNICRLLPDGSLDTSFNPAAGGAVLSIVVQPDGMILVGGSFTALAETPRKAIGRLNPDGIIDPGFNPGAGADVNAIALQPDGRILVGGAFAALGITGVPTARWHIGRLNPNGSVDPAFNPGANNSVVALAVQPDGKILVGGSFTTLGGGDTGRNDRNHLGRLNPDGSIDEKFDPGANAPVNAIAMQADGRILLAGTFFTMGGGESGGTSRNHIARLTEDGSLDETFNPGTDGPVYALATQQDGKILAAGAFQRMGGGGGSTPRSRIGRINTDASLDTDFQANADGGVSAIALQADGKILVGGFFVSIGEGNGPLAMHAYLARLHSDGTIDREFTVGANDVVYNLIVQPDGKILVAGRFTQIKFEGQEPVPRRGLARFNPDGSLDVDFDPGIAGDFVETLGLQPDGKILVGGSFAGLGGGSGLTPRRNLGRLNPDGSVDAAFDPGAGAPVRALAIQSDGGILVGGDFLTLGGGGLGTVSRFHLGRLNQDGSLDAAFNPGADGTILALLVQPDGAILAGGGFTHLGGGGTGTNPLNRIGRLSADGRPDLSFNPGSDDFVDALALQANGKILVGGNFSRLGGGGNGVTAASRIARLQPDGNLDAGFASGSDGTVWSIALQPDGMILVGGDFDQLGSETDSIPRRGIGRLSNNEACLQDLHVDDAGSTVTWMRGGASPELERVSFDFSPDGIAYTSVGSAARISGGWQLGGLSLPMGGTVFIRAQGFYPTGYGNGSVSAIGWARSQTIVAQVFAQVATGGGYRTILTGINVNEVATDIQASLVASDGTRFRTAAGAPVEPVAFHLEPMGTLRLEVALGGDTKAGYGLFSGSLAIGGTALFQSLHDELILSEAGVGVSKAANHFTVYIDNTGHAASGYALANDGASPAAVRLTLRDYRGTELDHADITLAPGHHFAEFAGQRFPATAPAGFEGSVDVTSDQELTGVALRYDNVDQEARSQVFSTIPVVVNESAETLYFPQVADGGGYRTNFILMNPGTVNAQIRLEFYRSDGTPMSLTIGGITGTSFERALGPKGVMRLYTEGTSSELNVGWVRVSGNAPIVGSSIFQTLGGARISSEAGVASSPLTQHFTTYVESTGSAWSGIAICNPNDTPTTLTLKLRRSDGTVSGTAAVELPAFGHDARFFTDPKWFPEAEDFEGTLEVSASQPVSAVALRYDNPQHNVFATLPVLILR